MRRSVTAVVGALAAGAVALPLSATSAGAAPDGVVDDTVNLSQTYLCVYAPPGQPREETRFPAKVEVKLDGGKVSVSLNEMPNFPKMPDIFTWRAMNARMPIVLNAETDVWAEGYLDYLTPGMQDGLKGSTPTIAMPVLSGSYDTAVVDARAVQMGNLTLKATVTVGTAPKLYDTDINCGLEGVMDQTSATLQAVNAKCAVQMPGAAAVTIPARVTSKVTVPAKAQAARSLSMNATTTIKFAGGLADALAPTDLTKIEASLKPVVTLGGKAAATSESVLTWQRRFGGRDPKGQSIDQFVTFTGNTPVKATPATAGSQAVTLAGFSGTAKLIGVAGTSSAPIDCTLDSAQALGAVKVERAAAQATTTKVKAAVTKKKTVKVTVRVSKKATGKATVVVTGGVKKVTKTVSVKRGKGALTLKKGQISKKGKYTVKVSFKGNADFKKSSGKRTFRIK